ncbi:MAG: hypothetical protein IKV88_06720 [Clostridia bacterium]|nr:hypothetical protein [Clostridia bacterium]
MYKIAVPIVCANIEICGGKEKILSKLKEFGAQRIMLALDSLPTNPEEREYELKCLKENTDFFKSHGYEVASWMWTFWVRGENTYTKIESADGKRSQLFACPLDEDFRNFVYDYVQSIAKCGVDIIQLDDDFRFGYITGSTHISCTCPLHMKNICRILGEEITPSELEEKVLTGGRNKYRDAWLKANGDALKNHAELIRSAVDKINPKIRVGFCSCMPSWDADGVDSVTLSKILAGDTKPLMRLIGAPYWSVEKLYQRSRLQNVIDLERMERSWCSDDIEIYSEGDAYPRPRTNCPSSYIELFDMAMRIDGRFDGIMKYGLDYFSDADYEMGYIDAHKRNKNIYEDIEKYFSKKKSVGIRVYESMNKIRDMYVTENIKESENICDTFFSPASHLLSDNSIPSTFEGDGICGIAFGENIKYVPESAFEKGLIIDARAAMILMEKGIDTGFETIGEGISVSREIVEESRMHLNYSSSFTSYICTLKENATLVSSSVLNSGKANEEPKKNPLVFRYENQKGQKFLVYNLEAYFCKDAILRGYARSKQISDASEWMCGEKLPAYAYGNPDFYIMCKESADCSKKSVGLFNFFADSVYEPKIELDTEYSEIEFINCKGELKGNTVHLSEIHPFSFAGFEVIK